MNPMEQNTTDNGLAHPTNIEKRRRRESGQSAVEMALMLPLLLLLIFGMLEMGWLATTRQTMDAITREATRAGTVAASTSVPCLPAGHPSWPLHRGSGAAARLGARAVAPRPWQFG